MTRAVRSALVYAGVLGLLAAARAHGPRHALTSERLRQPGDALDHFRAYLAARPDAEDKADVETRIAALRARLP